MTKLPEVLKLKERIDALEAELSKTRMRAAHAEVGRDGLVVDVLTTLAPDAGTLAKVFDAETLTEAALKLGIPDATRDRVIKALDLDHTGLVDHFDQQDLVNAVLHLHDEGLLEGSAAVTLADFLANNDEIGELTESVVEALGRLKAGDAAGAAERLEYALSPDDRRAAETSAAIFRMIHVPDFFR